MKKNIINILAITTTVFLVSLIIWVGINIQDKIEKSENTITVSATGEVYAKPDLALTTFSVITEAETVDEAMSQNITKMNMIIDSIKNQGVEEKDLKTTSFNIYPRYEWQKDVQIPPSPQGERVLVGYEIQQSLQVKIRDMEKIGDIIEKATQSGANQVGNLQFTIDKEDELKDQARAQAIEKAKNKAKELASQLGISLIRISNFQESGTFPGYYGLEKTISFDAGEEATPQPQIETGENKIEVTVTITYEIK